MKGGAELVAVNKLPKCNECGLPHWTARKGAVCLACRYFELVKTESGRLVEVIDFLRDKNLCAYCGEQAEDVEHVVPRASKLPTYTVPACRECNLFAGALLFPSFEAKAAHIQRRIRKRYTKVLGMPEWTEDEIEELGYALRETVRAYASARAWVRRRLDWSLSTALLFLEYSGA